VRTRPSGLTTHGRQDVRTRQSGLTTPASPLRAEECRGAETPGLKAGRTRPSGLKTFNRPFILILSQEPLQPPRVPRTPGRAHTPVVVLRPPRHSKIPPSKTQLSPRSG